MRLPNLAAIGREVGLSRCYVSRQVSGHEPMTREVKAALDRAEREALAEAAMDICEALQRRGRDDAARACLAIVEEAGKR